MAKNIEPNVQDLERIYVEAGKRHLDGKAWKDIVVILNKESGRIRATSVDLPVRLGVNEGVIDIIDITNFETVKFLLSVEFPEGFDPQWEVGSGLFRHDVQRYAKMAVNGFWVLSGFKI